jgi:hypothetical protein
MVATTQNGVATSVKVVATANMKAPVFSGKHGDEWIIWEMKMTAHLMDKGLGVCLEPDFKSKLPAKEIGPFDSNNEKEAVELKKKAMGQFIQAFLNISLLNKVNLERKADKDFPSRKAWKLWQEMKDEYNPDDSITEAELKLAMSRLQLNKKKNPRKIIEKIASCKVKYGTPVSDSKKIAQLICLGGYEYGTIISVTQMCNRNEGKTCMSKHLVYKMWKKWQIKGGKEEGEENLNNEEEEASLAKTDDKKKKGKDKKGNKDKDTKDSKKKETCTCNHCQKKGHIEKDCWEKHPEKMPEKFQKIKDVKTEKAGASVKEDEHLLSLVDVKAKEDDVDCEFHNKDVTKALVTIELGLEEDNIEDNKT